MGDIKIQPGTSGSGIYTIQGGSGDTDRTITLPNVADATLSVTDTLNNRNIVINGGMNIWQRAASASITSGDYHTADRWAIPINSIGTWTNSRSGEVPAGQGFVYSMKMDCTVADANLAAGDYAILAQRIEGVNLQALNKGTSSAKKVTLSFWVKSNKTGTYIVELYDNNNNRHINKSYDIVAADTWEKKTITYEGDETGTLSYDTNQAMRVQFWLGAGSDYSSGTLQSSWGELNQTNRAVGQVNLADSTDNEWLITGVQLEVGETASDFEHEMYVSLLRKCQRYYYRPNNSSYGWQGRRGGGRFFRVNNRTQGTVDLPVTMRAAPSFSATRLYGDGTWASGSVYAGNGWSNPTAPNYVNYEANVDVNAGSGNGGTFGFKITISAEL